MFSAVTPLLLARPASAGSVSAAAMEPFLPTPLPPLHPLPPYLLDSHLLSPPSPPPSPPPPPPPRHLQPQLPSSASPLVASRSEGAAGWGQLLSDRPLFVEPIPNTASISSSSSSSSSSSATAARRTAAAWVRVLPVADGWSAVHAAAEAAEAAGQPLGADMGWICPPLRDSDAVPLGDPYTVLAGAGEAAGVPWQAEARASLDQGSMGGDNTTSEPARGGSDSGQLGSLTGTSLSLDGELLSLAQASDSNHGSGGVEVAGLLNMQWSCDMEAGDDELLQPPSPPPPPPPRNLQLSVPSAPPPPWQATASLDREQMGCGGVSSEPGGSDASLTWTALTLEGELLSSALVSDPWSCQGSYVIAESSGSLNMQWSSDVAAGDDGLLPPPSSPPPPPPPRNQSVPAPPSPFGQLTLQSPLPLLARDALSALEGHDSDRSMFSSSASLRSPVSVQDEQLAAPLDMAVFSSLQWAGKAALDLPPPSRAQGLLVTLSTSTPAPHPSASADLPLVQEAAEPMLPSPPPPPPPMLDRLSVSLSHRSPSQPTRDRPSESESPPRRSPSPAAASLHAASLDVALFGADLLVPGREIAPGEAV
jgi:hypothetical protein